MKSDTPLDYAIFQLSPKRSRCELFVSSDGATEKLASGLLKPFTTHLKVAEEQAALAVQSIKLEAENHNNAGVWFTKGTLERFVRFVSTPEVLELVNTFDAEMSQLEAARRIYAQGFGDQHSNASGGDGISSTAAADATKQELLRAIDVRLVALKQDLTTASARASAAGFNPDTVSGLQHFANRFGAHRLNEACTKFLAVWERRPDLIMWKPGPGVDERAVRSSTGSNMLIEDLSGPEPDSAPGQQQQQLPKSLVSFPPANDNGSEKQRQEEDSPGESLSSSIQKSQPGRRLSVQDRINLFENKQKENSGGKPVVSKPAELRRLSSDVSSGPGPAVLRRWSGVSDMSIDVSSEKKDGESPLCTPSSSLVSQDKSNVFSVKFEGKNHTGLNDTATLGRIGVSGLKNEVESEPQTLSWNDPVKEDEAGLKARSNWKEQAGYDREVSLEDQRVSSADEERRRGRKDQVSSGTKFKGIFDRADIIEKNQGTSLTNIVPSGGGTEDVVPGSMFVNKDEDVEQKHLRVNQPHVRHSQNHIRPLSGQLEGGFGLKFRESYDKDSEDYQLYPQPQCKSSTGVVEEVRNKDLGTSEKSAAKPEDSGVQRMKFEKPIPARSEQINKSQGRREEASSAHGSNIPVFSVKVLDNEASFGTPVEQVQRVWQSKGNQDLNDELKMKANELEKLFAEHKLRAPGDQTGSVRRGKPADNHTEQSVSSQCQNPAAPEMSPVQLLDRNSVVESSRSSSNITFNTPPMKMVGNQDYGSRGKLYEKYKQKRNAKLKEEWSSNRAEKEAKMKAMRDNLEQSRAELKAKFANADNSGSSTRPHAEKLRSFNLGLSRKKEQRVDYIQSEEDEDPSYGQERSFNETFLGDGASRSSQAKKFLPSRNIPSSGPRTTPGAPIPRSSVKSPNPGSGKRKVQSENPVAQSVPNFSDFRKENTRPSSAVSKMTTRTQVRNYARSKTGDEEISLVKEDKTRRHQSVRKGFANPVELREASPVNSDDKEQTMPILYDTSSKLVGSKPFLRKGNGIGPGAGASIAKLKATMASEVRDEEEFNESPFDAEDSGDVVRKEDEELESMVVEDCDDMDNGKPSQELDDLGSCESANGDSIRSLSKVDPASDAELPAPAPSTFHLTAPLQDSPGESPISWNSRMHHPFSYQHETSDIDASVDSPVGSPASWNSHSLSQTDSDAARMRKKWGSAQKPILVSSSSHNQSRKDMTKGFKRLLKFGRKKSGTDSLVDWISATTSEGDDDTEDGRDLVSRLSEDLRKSRMGFSQGHPSDDSFNESELFSEQDQDLCSSIPAPPMNFKLREDLISGSSLKAPRSFFSLSTFRSKGSDSKPR